MVWYPPVFMSHIAVTLMLLAMICLSPASSRWPYCNEDQTPAHSGRQNLGACASSRQWRSVFHPAFRIVPRLGVVMRIFAEAPGTGGRKSGAELRVKPLYLVAVVGGIVLWGAFILKLHEWLIGVQPIAM